MRLATVLTPMSAENLQLSAQCGVTDVVTHYPGPELSSLMEVKRQVESFGLRLAVVEGHLPIERIKVGTDDGSDVAAMKNLIRNMGEAGVGTLCYNFMAGSDWVRTRLDAPERGGAKVTGFDLEDVEKSILLGHDATGLLDAPRVDRVDADQLWENLGALLNELVPVAEKAGVVLAMHPDDPPLPEFFGKARIMHTVDNFERLVALFPSSSNAVCFCQGTFTEIGVDIPATIRRLGQHIRYVHFRDVRGTADSFTETFHDNGPTDMVAAMQAYQDIGFDGPIRPDHVPQLVGEEHDKPGYTMLGRLFAFGYMRGLIQATSRQDSSCS